MCEDDFVGGLFVGGFTIGVIVLLVVGIGSSVASIKFETVEGTVTNVEFVSQYYMEVTFKDGSKYNINTYSGENGDNFLDFTDNSIVKMELRWESGMLNPNTNSCWGIVRIVKYDNPYK